MTDNPSPDTLAEGAQLTPADGGGTVGTPALTLAELNKHLGSDFKDAATALKALKDTKDFVGKRKEDIASEVKASLTPTAVLDDALKSDVQALKDRLFYSENPQYKGYEALIKKMGADPATVTDSEEFKAIFEKVKVADEVAQRKSNVPSNARLAQVKTVRDEAIATANSRGSTMEDLALVLARGINAD